MCVFWWRQSLKIPSSLRVPSICGVWKSASWIPSRSPNPVQATIMDVFLNFIPKEIDDLTHSSPQKAFLEFGSWSFLLEFHFRQKKSCPHKRYKNLFQILRLPRTEPQIDVPQEAGDVEIYVTWKLHFEDGTVRMEVNLKIFP